MSTSTSSSSSSSLIETSKSSSWSSFADARTLMLVSSPSKSSLNFIVCILFYELLFRKPECFLFELAQKRCATCARILATECICAPTMASTFFGDVAFAAAVYFFRCTRFGEDDDLFNDVRAAADGREA